MSGPCRHEPDKGDGGEVVVVPVLDVDRVKAFYGMLNPPPPGAGAPGHNPLLGSRGLPFGDCV